MKLVVSSAHSGGHFFPMMAFCEAWLEAHPNDEIHFWVSERAKAWAKDGRIQFKFLPHFYFKRYDIRSYFKLLGLFNQARQWMSREKPQVLVGAGGIHTFALVLASWFKKVPIILHEQNVHLGLANRVALPFVSRMAVSFQVSLAQTRSKGVWTGNLLRRSLRDARKQTRLNNRFCVLVIGGSQGAGFLNGVVLESVKQMTRAERDLFSWIHLTGTQEFDAVRQAWKTLDVVCETYPFYEAMEKMYPKSDLVMGRAGAGTLFEIAHFGLASIVIPYPYAKAHQMENAKVFQEKEACLVFDQNDITPEILKTNLLDLARNREKADLLGASAFNFSKEDALEIFVKQVEQLTAQLACCVNRAKEEVLK